MIHQRWRKQTEKNEKKNSQTSYKIKCMTTLNWTNMNRVDIQPATEQKPLEIAKIQIKMKKKTPTQKKTVSTEFA